VLPLSTNVDMLPPHIRPVASPSNDEDYSIQHIYAVDTYPSCATGGASALPIGRTSRPFRVLASRLAPPIGDGTVCRAEPLSEPLIQTYW